MSNDSQSGRSTWTILTLLQWTVGYLQRHGIDQARSDAEILLAHTLRCQRIDLYVRYDQPLVSEELSRFKELIKQRVAHRPVAYILGEKEFWSLRLKVTPDVLIPRPETECLVEAVLNNWDAQTPLTVLDLGTGSGAISIALASERPRWKFWAVDVSSEALAVARQNATRHRVAEQVEFVQGHWFEPFARAHQRFDLIVSNPPYIAGSDLSDLDPEVREHEPVMALDGGPQGLDCIEHIIRTSPAYLTDHGGLVLEIGYDQAGAVKDIGSTSGAYGPVSIAADYSGHDRVATLSKKSC